MYYIGYDIGTSSIKASLIEAKTGKSIGTAQEPEQEIPIDAVQNGWAEQNPELWWKYVCKATETVLNQTKIAADDIKGIGIAYQMHGLVLVDKKLEVIRPSIIWCDSRAVEIGDKAFNDIGEEECLQCYLNSPGNFTASKLKWVKENEPDLYSKIFKIMLPGDFIAMKLSGKVTTTVSGLSEGIMWDFPNNKLADTLLKHYGIESSLIPDIVPTFGLQGELSVEAANKIGLTPGTKITYRAGDQPNNALSLNVLNPGEIAATAGTSGVVYGVTDQIKYDPLSRVNTFAHVNHTDKNTSLGVLLCINGTAILNSWLKKITSIESYDEMNSLAEDTPIGSDGLLILPFGNGAERMLQNKNMGSQILGLDFNRHSKGHIIRAAHEGIAFSFKYGMEIMEETGIVVKVIRAGNANMFLSPIFRETLANITGASIELYNTDGSIGAARGAGIGIGYYNPAKEAFTNLKIVKIINPKENKVINDAYKEWKSKVNSKL
jgi:xylulokinase